MGREPPSIDIAHLMSENRTHHMGLELQICFKEGSSGD